MPTYTLLSSAKDNDPKLVKIVKSLLNATNLNRKDPLAVDEIADKKLFARASQFSMLNGVLTHQLNYCAMDEALGLGGALHVHPELAAREAQLAYRILSHGMRVGAFRNARREVGKGNVGGHKLADFFNDNRTDYVGARAIINAPSDKPHIIAGYALTFEAILEASVRI